MTSIPYVNADSSIILVSENQTHRLKIYADGHRAIIFELSDEELNLFAVRLRQALPPSMTGNP